MSYDSLRSPEEARQAVIATLLQILEETNSNNLPSKRILSGVPAEVKNFCGTFSNPRVAELLSDHHFTFRSVLTTHERPVGGGHMYLLDENDMILDPTAGMFISNHPPIHKNLFSGNLFHGSRQQLKEVITHPDTELTNISTKHDKVLSFARIWGNQSRDY